MNNPLPIIYTLCLAIQVHGQPQLQAQPQVRAQSNPAGDPNPPAVSLSALPPITLHLTAAHGTVCSGSDRLFDHFEVLDLRPDTARIGVHTNTPFFGRPRDRQLIFRRPVAIELADYLNGHFTTPGAPLTALIILRSLWLTDASYIREDMVRDPDRRFEKTHIRFKAEIYAVHNHRYLPVLRFDTLQATKKMIYYATLLPPYSDWDDNLVAIIDELADSCSRVAAQKKDQGNWIGMEEIRQFNASRFEAPIGNSIPLARGVYASFEEFRNNTPSIQDFEVKMEKNKRLLYIREAGKVYYSHSAWGYCDGKEIYIMRDGVLCPAWKEGKAFYFYSDIRKPRITVGDCPTPAAGGPTTVRSTPAGNLTAATRNNDYKQRFIYSIDMDTGVIY